VSAISQAASDYGSTAGDAGSCTHITTSAGHKNRLQHLSLANCIVISGGVLYREHFRESATLNSIATLADPTLFRVEWA
jgi:hypothetical protein